MFVSVEAIVPPADIVIFVPAVRAATTLVESVTSALASIAFSLLWSAFVKLFCESPPSPTE